MDDIEVTKHAYDRGRKRLGLPRKAVKRIARIAFNRHDGRKAEGKAGLVGQQAAAKAIVYGEHRFVFVGNKLITIMPLRFEYRRKMYYGR